MIAAALLVFPAVNVNFSANNVHVEAAIRKQIRHKKLSKRQKVLQEYAKPLRPYRTVGIDLKQSDPLYKLALEAIQDWNNTGVYTFKVLSPKAENADIWIHKQSVPDAIWSGITEDNMFATHIKYLTKAENRIVNFYPSHIIFNTGTTADDSDQYKKLVFEHELGHAIGLKHYNGSLALMNSEGNEHSTIHPIDIKHIKQIYHEPGANDPVQETPFTPEDFAPDNETTVTIEEGD